MFDGKTALLLGGVSPEREVSLTSGQAVGDALKRHCGEVLEFDTASRDLAELPQQGVQRVFNILHGGAGENGEVQGSLKMLGLPMTGSGVLGSALAMDKHRAKMIWRGEGISTPDWMLAKPADDGGDDGALALEKLGLPLFVKPSCGGSSTGSASVVDAADLAAAVYAAASEGHPALVERMIVGEEYTASVLEDKVLPLIKITVAGGYYDYHAKYIAEDTLFECPCGLPEEKEKHLAALALCCFQTLGCRHWGRVDFILDMDGEAQFLEVNTIPGMTSHSLVPMAAAAADLSFDELVCRVLRGCK